MVDARQAAEQELIRRGEEPSSFAVQKEERDDRWIVRFLPVAEGRRGGGFEIQVNKSTGEVTRVIRYQ